MCVGKLVFRMHWIILDSLFIIILARGVRSINGFLFLIITYLTPILLNTMDNRILESDLPIGSSKRNSMQINVGVWTYRLVSWPHGVTLLRGTTFQKEVFYIIYDIYIYLRMEYRQRYPYHMKFMSLNINTTGATNGAGTTYASRVHYSSRQV